MISHEAAQRVRPLQERIAPLRQELLAHPIYQRIAAIADLRLFMRHHVFAVWDFMSLLKSLQRRLTCVDVPWLPPADAAAARLINEIVLGEETDTDGQGGYASHFELYRRAMIRCGAETSEIDRFASAMRDGATWRGALVTAEVPPAVRRFVERTFAVIESGDLPELAAAFTFGREDLLPDVFQRVVDELRTQPGSGLDDFVYYLRRHIELDGDEHGPMAIRLVTSVCGDDELAWQRAEEAAVGALAARRDLWDAMLAALPQEAAVRA